MAQTGRFGLDTRTMMQPTQPLQSGIGLIVFFRISFITYHNEKISNESYTAKRYLYIIKVKLSL
jgi:hypothetical protein